MDKQWDMKNYKSQISPTCSQNGHWRYQGCRGVGPYQSRSDVHIWFLVGGLGMDMMVSRVCLTRTDDVVSQEMNLLSDELTLSC